MKWDVVIQKMGEIEARQDGVEADPFQRILHNYTGPVSRVSVNVGRSVPFAEVKVSTNVSIDCPQKEAYIDLAGEIVFMKALELTNDGMSQFGVERIGE